MELPGGIRRITCELPTRPGHVHTYLLPGDDGWTLVDTGLGLPDAAEWWAAELAGVPGEVTRILITHFHPDHVGAAADVAVADAARPSTRERSTTSSARGSGQTTRSGRGASPTGSLSHGVPRPSAEELIESGSVYAPFVRYQPDPVRVDEGDRLDGWELVAAPGHADGQLCLLKDEHPRLRRPPARPDLTRPSASGPRAGRTRSATTSTRCAGRSSSRPVSRCPGTASRSRIRSPARTS